MRLPGAVTMTNLEDEYSDLAAAIQDKINDASRLLRQAITMNDTIKYKKGKRKIEFSSAYDLNELEDIVLDIFPDISNWDSSGCEF